MIMKIRIEHITTSLGDFTNAWLDGKHSKLLGHLTKYQSFHETNGRRNIMKDRERNAKQE